MIVLKISKAKLLPLLRAFEVFAPCRCLPFLGMAAPWSTGCPQETCIVKAVQRFDRRRFYEILSKLRYPAGKYRKILPQLRYARTGNRHGSTACRARRGANGAGIFGRFGARCPPGTPRTGCRTNARPTGKRRPGGGPASARRTGRRCPGRSPCTGTANAHHRSPAKTALGRRGAVPRHCGRAAAAG